MYQLVRLETRPRMAVGTVGECVDGSPEECNDLARPHSELVAGGYLSEC